MVRSDCKRRLAQRRPCQRPARPDVETSDTRDLPKPKPNVGSSSNQAYPADPTTAAVVIQVAKNSVGTAVLLGKARNDNRGLTRGEFARSGVPALLDEVLDRSMISDAVHEALELVQGDPGTGKRQQEIDTRIAAIESELFRLIGAIAARGEMAGLVDGIGSIDEAKAALLANVSRWRSSGGSRRRTPRGYEASCSVWHGHEPLDECAEGAEEIHPQSETTHNRKCTLRLVYNRPSKETVCPRVWRTQCSASL
jgi:hypothetical protein